LTSPLIDLNVSDYFLNIQTVNNAGLPVKRFGNDTTQTALHEQSGDTDPGGYQNHHVNPV
jgi:hypothetical protein